MKTNPNSPLVKEMLGNAQAIADLLDRYAALSTSALSMMVARQAEEIERIEKKMVAIRDCEKRIDKIATWLKKNFPDKDF